jgi:hypothetical protein
LARCRLPHATTWPGPLATVESQVQVGNGDKPIMPPEPEYV